MYGVLKFAFLFHITVYFGHLSVPDIVNLPLSLSGFIMFQ